MQHTVGFLQKKLKSMQEELNEVKRTVTKLMLVFDKHVKIQRSHSTAFHKILHVRPTKT